MPPAIGSPTKKPTVTPEPTGSVPRLHTRAWSTAVVSEHESGLPPVVRSGEAPGTRSPCTFCRKLLRLGSSQFDITALVRGIVPFSTTFVT